ncbi:hypothetical protein PINS_up019601, partial [Pythium insidiosum]
MDLASNRRRSRDDGVVFSSRFDSGNLQHVARVARDEFHVTLAEDAVDSRAFTATGYTTWFYFEMRVTSSSESADCASSSANGQLLGSQRKIRLNADEHEPPARTVLEWLHRH